MADEAVKLLCSSLKIERDRGVVELQKFLADADDKSVKALQDAITSLLCDASAPWETRHGALMGAGALLTLPSRTEYGGVLSASEDFPHVINEFALKLLNDAESRVRLAAGELMGTLCFTKGTEIYVTSKDIILEGVRSNLERQPLSEVGQEEQENAEKLMEKLSSSPRGEKRRSSTDAEQIFHDTAGWKSLETWMKCLQSVIEGSGRAFNAYIDQDLLDLIFQALTHTNRFVRETGYYVCSSLVSCNFSEDEEEMANLAEDNAIYRHGNQFAQQLATGLADNWSQVRLAASVATRQFLVSLPQAARETFFPLLLPPLCLNRYYVAEGVRIYNQDTWRQVTGGDGKHLVEQYIRQVVDFYISQTEADNHAVREAACACIAELGSKIDKDVVRPYVPELLDALLVCFKDQSWPVRDASCVACGNFVLCFPDESRSSMESLYPLFYENLQDNIPSVRQGAAIALANVIRAYGQEASEVVLGKVKEGLGGVEKQPENTEKYSAMDTGPATYGVVKRLRDNDMELHSNQTMYSCGSLAPKMSRGKRGGGCMDHQFRRPSEPWELADGCVYLMGEMSSVPELTPAVCKNLELLAKAAGHQHYTQHVQFLETVCKELPVIAKGIGKRSFKMYLELFFDPLFYSLVIPAGTLIKMLVFNHTCSCDNALTSSAASQCLSQLSILIGPNILRGRVEQYNPRYLDQLSANQFIGAL